MGKPIYDRKMCGHFFWFVVLAILLSRFFLSNSLNKMLVLTHAPPPPRNFYVTFESQVTFETVNIMDCVDKMVCFCELRPLFPFLQRGRELLNWFLSRPIFNKIRYYF